MPGISGAASVSLIVRQIRERLVRPEFEQKETKRTKSADCSLFSSFPSVALPDPGHVWEAVIDSQDSSPGPRSQRERLGAESRTKGSTEPRDCVVAPIRESLARGR